MVSSHLKNLKSFNGWQIDVHCKLTLDRWGQQESHQVDRKYSCCKFQSKTQTLHSYCPHPPGDKSVAPFD